MNLYKNFALGGLFQAGRRMATPWGSFRRFTNAFIDSTDTLKPYGRGLPVDNSPTIQSGSGAAGATFRGPIASQVFRKGILQFLNGESGADNLGLFSYLGSDGNLIPIMQPFNGGVSKNTVRADLHNQYLPSGNLSTCTVARKAFMASCVDTTAFDPDKDVGGFTPEESYLMSFDGLRLRGAGLPTPWNFVDNTGTPGSFYVRGIYATIGMDGELIMSPYMQVRLAGATKDLYLSGYTAYPATPRSDAAGTTGVVPAYRRPEDSLFERITTPTYGFGAPETNLRYFDKRYINAGGGLGSVVGGELSIVQLDKSACVDVGDWLMVDIGSELGTISATLYMFQVKVLGATSGSTTIFERYFKYFDQNTVSWVDADFLVIFSEWNAINVDIGIQFLGKIFQTVFSNLFMITAYSATANAGYAVSNIEPVAWDSSYQKAANNFTSVKSFRVPWAGVVSSLMADWYDINTVRTTFPPLKGITNYKELLVGFDSKAIYFTDISLGGSTEMVGGLSNIIPYGSEYGDIVAVCGSEDFLLVSRERKNYVITGDIAGSSFNISECDLAVPGAYNARCATNAWSGMVIFVNAAGVFAVTSSGAIKDIGKEIKGLFFNPNRDNNLFDKTIFKTIAETRAAGKDGGIFKFTLEDLRGFVILFTAKANNDPNFSTTGSNMLVYNTLKDKWYEFEGGDSSSVESLYGKIFALGETRAKEDGVMRGTEKELLVSQWMTVDSPSLEKQMCQLKIFGEFTPTTAGNVRGMTVGHQNNWENFNSAVRTNWITNTVYSPPAYDIYEHKKRLDSSKPRAFSFILESLDTGSFDIEGMEIEGDLIQKDLKK